MRRRVFTFFSTVSAMFFVLAAGMWVRGFFAGDAFSTGSLDATSGRFVRQSVQIGGGRVIYFRVHQTFNPQQAAKNSRFYNYRWTHDAPPPSQVPGASRTWGWMLFGYSPVTIVSRPVGAVTAPTVIGWFAGVHLLAIVPLCAVLPGLWTIQFFRRRRRNRPGCCPTCGYDLRATPEQGGALLDRCPECGRKRMLNSE